ncbi:MAG: hypothetical protein HQL10_14020 [Nitrospirae bacterium]|nr:hypothetical protein [Nitrospirota bacterium]
MTRIERKLSALESETATLRQMLSDLMAHMGVRQDGRRTVAELGMLARDKARRITEKQQEKVL